MKKLLTHIVFLLLGVILSLSLLSSEAIAAKSKKGNSAQELLKVINNSGETVVYGSVLRPKEDEVNINLSKKILKKIRTVGIDNLSINLTSSLDSTKTYSVPSDAINLARKKINKTSGKYLVISIFNLSTPSGITISPSSLPTGNYKLRVQGKELDITTDAFNYQTPALIVGTVDSNTTGLVTVEDLQGNNISGRTVTTNPNGTFFTEVRADKINSNTKARRYLKSQVDNNEEIEDVVVEEINTGVVHCVTDTDLYSIVPLNNNPDNNDNISNKPIEVNASSTLTANLAKENEELASEVAKNQLEELASDEDSDDEFNGNEFTCDIGDIGQFADKCPDNEEDTESFASIGAQFKEFVKNANCNFPEFRLIKKIIPLLPDFANAQIGIGYCEISRETNDDRPCEIYSEILEEFEEGNIDEIPCPPPFCEEFKDIKPPICVAHGGFCEGPRPLDTPFESSFQVCRGPRCPREQGPEPCFHRPEKDLYCKRIGVDIKADECKSPSGFRSGPNWTIVKNSEGNEYCVPGNINPPPSSPAFFEEQFPRTPQDIAEECEVNACHQSCDEEFGFPPPYIFSPPPPFTPPPSSVPPSGGYFPPPPPPPSYLPPPSGRISSELKTQIASGFGPGGYYEPPKCEACDCHRKCDAEAGRLIECNDREQYFSKKCCERGSGPIIFFAQTTYAGQFHPGGFGNPGFGKGPIGINLFDCLCKDTINNFNEKGYVKPEAQKACLESCPQGYEKDPNSDQCLPICPEGAVRDPGGICRKKCPAGFIQDDFRGCRCPDGQYVGPSGKCESSSSCPSYCKNYPVFRKLLASHDLTGFGTTSSYTPPYTGSGYVPPSTGPGYIPPGSTNTLPPECQRCLDSSCPSGFKKDPSTGNCINVSNSCGNSNMLPNNVPGEAQCICPPALPYWDNNTNSCVATCPNGNPPATSSQGLPKSPIPCNSTTQSNYCSPGITVGTNACTCNPSGGAYNSNGYCTCSTNSGYTKEYGCTSSTTRPCTVGEGPSNNCYCFGGGYTGADGKCQCSNGVQYTGGGCNSTSYYCPIGQGPSNGCQCNIQGGTIVGSNGQCQCPSGSSQSYSPASGCGTSTINCPPPYIKDPAFSNSGSCICPPGTPYELGSTCVATCPSNLIPSTSPGGPYSSTRQVCKCSDGTYPNASGTCTTSSSLNYCSPGIVPTTSNPCTCNPSGGGYFGSGNTCICPSGSSSPYTKETGCSSSTTTRPCTTGEGPSNSCYCFGSGYTGSDGKCQCSSGVQYTGGGCGTTTTNCQPPYITNPSGMPPCKCPDGTYSYNSACVATCPSPLVTGTPSSGGMPSCLCPGTLQYPGANGQCDTTTTHTCALGEVNTSSNPCTCASGAIFGSNGQCQCTNGQVYASGGCPVSTTPTPSPTPSPTPTPTPTPSPTPSPTPTPTPTP